MHAQSTLQTGICRHDLSLHKWNVEQRFKQFLGQIIHWKESQEFGQVAVAHVGVGIVQCIVEQISAGIRSPK